MNPAQRQRIMGRDDGHCHVCQHPNAEQIDHVIGVKQWMREQRDGSPHRDGNLAPIHQQPCPTCGVRCHAVKTKRESQQGRAVVDAGRLHPREQHPGLNRA